MSRKSLPQEIVITRDFDAPPELVYRAWTDPDLLMQWFGPQGFTSPHCAVDLRVGGTYLFCMRSPEGQDFWSGGTYREIAANERLVCSDHFADERGRPADPTKYGLGKDFPKESVVAIAFEKSQGKTRLTIRYAPETAAAREEMLKAKMAEGWNSSLDKLARLLESQSRAR